jgi:hypothetical protein
MSPVVGKGLVVGLSRVAGRTEVMRFAFVCVTPAVAGMLGCMGAPRSCGARLLLLDGRSRDRRDDPDLLAEIQLNAGSALQALLDECVFDCLELWKPRGGPKRV